jgi:hypothetical protein
VPLLDILTSEESFPVRQKFSSLIKKPKRVLSNVFLHYPEIDTLTLYFALNEHSLPEVALGYPFIRWHNDIFSCKCALSGALRQLLAMNENKEALTQALLFTPETVRVSVQEVIRMRSAARKSYGLIQELSIADRTKKIVEIHAAITKMKAFLQEMIIAEGEVLEELSEEDRAEQRKLDRAYKSARGTSAEEKAVKKEKKEKAPSNSYAELAKAAGMDINDILAKLKK